MYSEHTQICKVNTHRYIVTLTFACCDTVFHIRRQSSDMCGGWLGSALISSDAGVIDVGGLTWQQVNTSNPQSNCGDDSA